MSNPFEAMRRPFWDWKSDSFKAPTLRPETNVVPFPQKLPPAAEGESGEGSVGEAAI